MLLALLVLGAAPSPPPFGCANTCIHAVDADCDEQQKRKRKEELERGFDGEGGGDDGWRGHGWWDWFG